MSTNRAAYVLPCRMVIERIARDLEADILRKRYRQGLLRHWEDAAGAAVDDWDRATPVALARAPPVAQPIGRRALAAAQRLEPLGGSAFGIGRRQAVEGGGDVHRGRFA